MFRKQAKQAWSAINAMRGKDEYGSLVPHQLVTESTTNPSELNMLIPHGLSLRVNTE